MKAIDYFKEKSRMTKDCKITCSSCPFSCFKNGKNVHGKNVHCSSFESTFPEQAIEIIEKWAKENPPKTYLSVLLERLPNVTLNNDGTPKFCPTNIFKVNDKGCPVEMCIDCWNREYKEETNEQ